MILASLLLSVAIVAAVPSAASTTLREDDLRVASVAYRLAERGRILCPETFPLTGLQLHHLAEYDPRDRPVQIDRHGLDRGPGVLATVADSPAARAGLAAGDILVALDGTPFPDPRLIAAQPDHADRRAAIEASDALLEAALRRGPAELRLIRGGRTMSVELRPGSGCPARIRLARSNQPNAFANRGHVVVTTRILESLQGDDELAIIIAHELAHVILRHDERLRARGSRLGTRAAEEEADRLGIKLVHAAGYDVRAAIPMWRRLHSRFGGGLALFDSHPGLGSRVRSIEATIRQLEPFRVD